MLEVVPLDDWSEHGLYHPGHQARFAPPAKALVLHQSVTNLSGDDLTDARAVDQVTKDRGQFNMVPYSALIGQASVFGGRDDRYRNGANRNTRSGELGNTETLSACLMGNYHPDVPGVAELEVTQLQQDLIVAVHARWVERGSLRPNAPIIGHRDLAFTSCNGDNAYGLLAELNTRVAWANRPIVPVADQEDLEMITQLINDIDAEVSFLQWNEPDGRVAVRRYNTYRAGYGSVQPGASWIAAEQVAAGNWVDRTPSA